MKNSKQYIKLRMMYVDIELKFNKSDLIHLKDVPEKIRKFFLNVLIECFRRILKLLEKIFKYLI